MDHKTKTELFTFLPLAVVGLVLFAIVKWGGAKGWEVVVIVLAGVVLSGSILGPSLHGMLASVPGGYLH